MNINGRQRASTKRDITARDVVKSRRLPADVEVWVDDDAPNGRGEDVTGALFVVWQEPGFAQTVIRTARRDYDPDTRARVSGLEAEGWRKATDAERVEVLAGRLPVVDLSEVGRWRA